MIKRILLSVLLILAVIIALTNCCSSHMRADLHFTQSDLNINPYKGSEQLVFRSLTGESFNIAIRGRYKNGSDMYGYKDYSDKNKCKGDYYYTERDETGFSNVGSWLFSIILSFDYTLNNQVYDKSIEFMVDLKNGAPASYSEAHFNSDTIYDKYPSRDSVYIFHKSITLGPKSFENVYELFLYRSLNLDGEWATTLYYTIKEGIVGFNTDLGNKWYLAQIN